MLSLDAVQSALENQFPGCKDTPELCECVMDTVPLDDLKIILVEGTAQKWRADINCKLKNRVDVDNFIKDYLLKNGEALKISCKKKVKEKSEMTISEYYRCHHNTRYDKTKNASEVKENNPSKRFKNTNCPFVLSLKVYKSGEYPCLMKIEWNHNHPINSLAVSSHMPILPETNQLVESLFEKGLTPALAYYEFIDNLRKRHSELDFHLKKADRLICPRRSDFNSMYRIYCDKMFGGKNGQDMFLEMEEKLNCIQADGKISVDWKRFNGADKQPLIVTLVTPLMKRVHKMVPQAGEMLFIDSTSSLEEHNLRFFLLCTHSVCGALPLGIMITSDEQESTITLALEMLFGLLPSDCFYGNGTTTGPNVVMTDNCDELRNVLRMKWPNTKLLLCTFHILQQLWRWVFEKKHNIDAIHRKDIMVLFKKLLYSSSIEELDGMIEEVLKSPIILKYHDLKLYLGSLLNRKEEWAICYRQNLLVRGSQTNNYVESQFLVLKDTILRRTRQFNINALLTKIFNDFEEHFKLKLLSVADGSFDGIYSKRFKGLNQNSGNKFNTASNDVQEIVLSGCIHQGNNFFIVPSKSSPNKTYMVDMTIGRCECHVGADGSPCFHQFILWKNGLSTSCNFLPYLDRTERKKFADLAIGTSLDLSYYDSLHCFLQADALNHSEEIDGISYNESVAVPSGDSSLNTAVPEKSNEDYIELARNAHSKISDKLLQHIGENVEFNKSLIKFEERLSKLSDSQLNSALNQFGSSFFTRAHRGKIFTQPTAVSRRRKKIGSRRKQDTRGDSHKRTLNDNLPQRRTTLKRRHNISEMIDSGLPSAKKSGSLKMKTNVTYPRRKK